METFYWLKKDKTLAKVEYGKSEQVVYVTNYTDNPLDKPFGINNNPSWDDLVQFLEGRCFPKTRANKKQILDHLGLQYYDVFDITRINHGQMVEDYYWLKYEHEKDLKYSDVNWRDINNGGSINNRR